MCDEQSETAERGRNYHEVTGHVSMMQRTVASYLSASNRPRRWPEPRYPTVMHSVIAVRHAMTRVNLQAYQKHLFVKLKDSARPQSAAFSHWQE